MSVTSWIVSCCDSAVTMSLAHSAICGRVYKSDNATTTSWLAEGATHSAA